MRRSSHFGGARLKLKIRNMCDMDEVFFLPECTLAGRRTGSRTRDSKPGAQMWCLGNCCANYRSGFSET